MARVIASPTSDRDLDRDLTLGWTGRLSLTVRILAVNVLALLLLAGGFFYLDSYRSRLVDSRTLQQTREAALMAEALSAVRPEVADRLLLRLAADTGTRLRSYAPDGRLIADSKALGLRNFALRDPDLQSWRKDFARYLDAAIDTVVGAARDPLVPRARPQRLARREGGAGRANRRRRSGARPSVRRSSPPPRRWLTAARS